MKKFIIERELPGAGELTEADLQAIANKSCEVIRDMKAQYLWEHTYVTGNKLYCVHMAPDEQTVMEHAKAGGFPVTRIQEVKTIISPATATQFLS